MHTEAELNFRSNMSLWILLLFSSELLNTDTVLL
jgi:hypothetical protein